MDKVLKIYYSNNGVEAPFPNSELQAELYSFQYDCKRMGTAPTITASVMYPLCLDNNWTDSTYVYFRGEKYYLSNKPSSSYSNTDARYKHELTFVSERKILENIYFTDGILTDFHFFGDLNMLAGRLNAFFTQSSLSYRVFVDSGITTEEKDVEINKLYVNDALAKGFEIFNVPYYFVGTDIHFGYYQNEISETFEYGVDNALLSVNRENSNNKIVTRITGVGSSENIPYYYPNFNESGEHDVTTDPIGYADDISKLNYLKIDPYTSLRNGGYAQYYKACVNPIGGGDSSIFDNIFITIDDRPEEQGYNTAWEEKRSWNVSQTENEYFTNLSIGIQKNYNVRIIPKGQEIIYINTAIEYKSDDSIVFGSLKAKNIQVNARLVNNQIVSIPSTKEDDFLKIEVPQNIILDYGIIIQIETETDKFSKDIQDSSSTYYPIKLNFTYDTQYSTSSSNTTVKSTNGTIDEKTYLDFNKVIDYPNGATVYSNTFTYKVTREVAGYSTASLNSVFKGVFLDNNGGDMSEWNHFIPNSIVVKNGNGTIINHHLSQGNYIYFRNTSNTRQTFTIEMSVIVQMSTESTDIKAYGVKLKYIPAFNRKENPYDYWKFHDGKEVKYSIAGIKFNDTSAIPDGLKVNFSATKNWIEPKPYLMPSVYRNTKGLNIWYNAVNNRYKDENGNFISFVNQYNPNSPKEHISDPKEYIKPSIVGITVNGQRIDQFADIAFDTNDNNDEWITDDDGNNQTLKHSFFFVKLRRKDFNLFDQALEKGEMTISMTSGHCGSCNFTIMVDEETQKNTVQVDSNGILIRDDEGNVKFGSPQDVQQDTTKTEVWIALRKEEDSYGVIMPDKANDLIPIADKDTFIFTNILLPNDYIEKAENRLQQELLKDLKENNEEKFDFSIDFSRIYLAENAKVYDSINENAKVYVKYNGIENELYIDSYSYRMDADEPLPQIKVDLKRSISVVKNAIQKSEGKIIQYVKEVVVNNQKEVERNVSKGSSTTQNGDISVVQEMGFSEASVMSQKAVTEAINAVEENITEVTQYMGQSTDKVMSQKAVTNELKKLSNNKVEVVQETGDSTLSVMSQKAVADALTLAKPTFDGIEDSVKFTTTTESYDAYDGSVVYISSNKCFAYKVGTSYYRNWHSSAMYNTNAPKALTNTVFKNTSNNQDYIFDGTDLVLLTTGGSNITISQTTGLSTTAVMSQKAVTDELTKIQINNDFNSIPKFSRIIDADANGSIGGSVITSSTKLDGEIVYLKYAHPLHQEGFYWFATDGNYYNWWSTAGLFKTNDYYTKPNKIFECESDSKQYVFFKGNDNRGFKGYLKELDLPLVKITYNELLQLIDNKSLISGIQYRITDFVTTCNSAGSVSGVTTSSANHPFDIIVTADDNDTLNANARVCLHEGDTYFANNNLSEWVIKYDINNDNLKYHWADTTKGKGVIYYMCDEFGNEAPYDFKNILFDNHYTMSVNTSDDFSLMGTYCFENKIKGNYIGEKLILNNIVMITEYVSRLMANNIFDINCNNIRLVNSCHNNIFSTMCMDIILQGNSFISFSPQCEYITVSAGLRNVCVKNGVYGSSSEPLVISASTGYYVTTVARNSAGVIKIYNEADLVGGGVVDNTIQHINTILDSVITGEELDNMDDLLYQISQSSQDLSLINSQLEEIING